MTFYVRLIKIIHSYFSLGWRGGRKVSDVKCAHQIHSLLDYSCIHHICSAVSQHQYCGHEKNMADERSCGKKASLFPLVTQTCFLRASRSDANNGKYVPVSNTLSKALRESPLWPVWPSVQRGSQKLQSDSLSWPHTLMARCFGPSTRLTINCLRWWQPFISLGI